MSSASLPYIQLTERADQEKWFRACWALGHRYVYRIMPPDDEVNEQWQAFDVPNCAESPWMTIDEMGRMRGEADGMEVGENQTVLNSVPHFVSYAKRHLSHLIPVRPPA